MFPWAKIEKPEPTNLLDIMSEEIARDLQAKEDKKFLGSFENSRDITETVTEDIPVEVAQDISHDNCKNDALIAQLLQMQYDKQHDQELKRSAEKINGTSKVSISFENYRRAPLNDDFESDLEEDEIIDIQDRKDWDRFGSLEKELASIPACGYKVNEDGNIVTKHDTDMNGRKNACKLLSFPPEFRTGDGETFDLKLSNKVFNSLKRHSRKEQVKQHKVQDKRDSTSTNVFGLNGQTCLLLNKMIGNVLETIDGVVSIGKEAVILHAVLDPSFPKSTENWPKECAIKVFKMTHSEFKQRDKYIKDDHRFKDRMDRNQTSRQAIELWAEKEMANLSRLQRAGIPCPQIISLKNHVLVMSFIGKDNQPAPKLKNARLSDADIIMAYKEVKNAMKLLYEDANLIHADLSEYNILWHEEQCYFIDVSQSVEPAHENAYQFLYRDCFNITNFFGKRIPEIETPDELFKCITGCEFQDKIALQNLKESFKMKPHLVDRPGIELNYNFDTTWEHANAGKVPVEVEKVISEIDVNLVDPPKA